MFSGQDFYQDKSSQESLPLSQDTYQTLVNGLFELGSQTNSYECATDISKRLVDYENLSELDPFVSNQVSYAPDMKYEPPPNRQASCPAVSDWAGDFGFNVFFEEKEPLSKKVNWTFSTSNNRLYVKKGQSCPVNFSTNCLMGGAYIRAMCVYTDPQFSTEGVRRCVNHSKNELEQGIYEAEHLVRSASPSAVYHQDISQRQSVIVPLEDPQCGQSFSTFLYYFPCYNSCSGGPNRRRLTIIFSLEKINDGNLVVVGRKCFQLKVCACPGRDRLIDEGCLEDANSSAGPPPKKKLKENNVAPTNVLSAKPSQKREYIIKVKDEESYRFLAEMKKVKDIGTRSFLLHMRNCRQLYYKRKENNFVPLLNAYVNYMSSSNSDD